MKNCNEVKREYTSVKLNTILFIGFVLVVGIVLYYRNKNKDINKLIKQKNEDDAKREIYKKVNEVSEEQYKMDGKLITNIPKFEENAFEGTMRDLDKQMEYSNKENLGVDKNILGIDKNSQIGRVNTNVNHTNVMIDNMPNINNINVQSNQEQIKKMISPDPLQAINFTDNFQSLF